jgi:hypothetical protein
MKILALFWRRLKKICGNILSRKPSRHFAPAEIAILKIQNYLIPARGRQWRAKESEIALNFVAKTGKRLLLLTYLSKCWKWIDTRPLKKLHDLPEWALVATTRPVGSFTEFIGWL